MKSKCNLLQERVGDVGFFAECAGHDPCVTPGVYAIIGSAAMLSAVSRMTGRNSQKSALSAIVFLLFFSTTSSAMHQFI